MRQEISFSELVFLRESGQLKWYSVCDVICLFCEDRVCSTEKDQHDKVLPYCVECGVFYQPKWDLREGILYLEVEPKTVGDTQVSVSDVPYFYKDSLLAVKEHILGELSDSACPVSQTELLVNVSGNIDQIQTALSELVDCGLVEVNETGGVLSYTRGAAEPLSEAPTHKNVAASVRQLLEQEKRVSTQQLAEQIDASRQSIDAALKKLINTGEIRKVKRGVYETVG